ncbi:MAG: hypothetical protein MJE12_08645, partial [Alphaproteobacteria bacterium]|nr:hypothetical protein [Alphaproteobacteria bacterium]
LQIAEEEGLPVDLRAFTVEEAKSAREAFVSSATSFTTPVVQIDDDRIGDGTPGGLSRRLLEAYNDYAAGRRAAASRRPAAQRKVS